MLRKATSSDCEEISKIYNNYVLNSDATFETSALSVEEIRARFEKISEKFPYYVYEEGGEVLGFCYAHFWKERAAYCHSWELAIYVASGHTTQGIGKKMLSKLIEESRVLGCHALIACITKTNTASIALHEKFGFKKVSDFVQVGKKFGKFIDVVDMELLL